MTVSMEHLSNTSAADRVELPADGLVRLRASGRGLRLAVERGTVLVTREGDPADHVLEAGGSLLVTGRGLVIAWALAPATVAVSRPAAPRALVPAARPA